MRHTDVPDAMARAERGQGLIEAVSALLGSAWAGTVTTAPKAWWTPRRVVLVWVLMAWLARGGLVERFEQARPMLGDPRRARTYQGLVKANARLGELLWPRAMAQVRRRIDEGVESLRHASAGREDVKDLTCLPWRPFACDGSRPRLRLRLSTPTELKLAPQLAA